MSNIRVNTINDAAGGSAAVLYGIASPPNSMGFRNRLINSDMRIDQRNAGASVSNIAGPIYTLDRWVVIAAQASKITIQRNAGTVTPPAGFTNYLGITSSSSYPVTANESFSLEQIIEGFNVADLNWGTASAVPATLSFWVRSSLTGTFGGSIATTKTAIWVMPFSYTVSVADTWTYVTVSVTAPTATGGANTDNTAGVYVRLGLGATGTSAGGTAGVWTNASNYTQPSGTVSVVGTNGATFYITGVQLEAGTVASPFERRDYGRELMMCQRYFYRRTVGSQNNERFGMGMEWSTSIQLPFQHFTPMRVAPSISSGNVTNINAFDGGAGITGTCSSVTLDNSGVFITNVLFNGFSNTGAGRACHVCWNNAAPYPYVDFSSEL